MQTIIDISKFIEKRIMLDRCFLNAEIDIQKEKIFITLDRKDLSYENARIIPLALPHLDALDVNYIAKVFGRRIKHLIACEAIVCDDSLIINDPWYVLSEINSIIFEF